MRRLLKSALLSLLLALPCSAALSDNLVAYYKLDEASGNAVDALGANDLTETSGSIGTTTGKINGARACAGGDTEYFERTDNATFSTGDIDFSFQVWVNATSLVSFPVVFRKGANGARDYILYIDTSDSNKPAWEVSSNGASGTTVKWGTGLTTSTWYHIVCWHDAAANQIGIAVNAGTAVTSSHSTGVQDGAGTFQLGAGSDQGLYWDGLIDEFGMWKRVLSSGERTSLYNGGSGLPYSSFGGGAAPRQPRPPGGLNHIRFREYVGLRYFRPFDLWDERRAA